MRGLHSLFHILPLSTNPLLSSFLALILVFRDFIYKILCFLRQFKFSCYLSIVGVKVQDNLLNDNSTLSTNVGEAIGQSNELVSSLAANSQLVEGVVGITAGIITGSITNTQVTVTNAAIVSANQLRGAQIDYVVTMVTDTVAVFNNNILESNPEVIVDGFKNALLVADQMDSPQLVGSLTDSLNRLNATL